MSFEDFMAKVNAIVAQVAGGMEADDFADACWYDLYEEVGEDVTKEDVYYTLGDADDVFREMLEAQGIEYE